MIQSVTRLFSILSITLFAGLVMSDPIYSLPGDPPVLEVCPGCVDATGSFTAGGGLTAGNGTQVIPILQKIDGECIIIQPGPGCTMAQPCTPLISIIVCSFNNGGKATGSGSAGQVGLGRAEVDLSNGCATVYEDFIGVDCGSSLDFNYSVSFTAGSGPPVRLSATLVCTACD